MLTLTSVHPCLHPYANPSVPAAVEIPIMPHLHHGLPSQGSMSAQYASGYCSSFAQIPSHLQGNHTTHIHPYHSSQGITNFMTRYDLTQMSRPVVGHQQSLVRVTHIQHIPHAVGLPSDRRDFVYDAKVYHSGPAPQLHASLPPFSMFSSTLAKETSRALMPSKKSGFEAAAQRFQRMSQKGEDHSSFLDVSKSLKQKKSITIRKERKKRCEQYDAGFLEVPNGVQNKDLSHSIASILSEESVIPVNQNSTILKHSFSNCDGSGRSRNKATEAYDGDAQSDVDVTSCSGDELECASKMSENVDENEHFEIEQNDSRENELNLTPINLFQSEEEPTDQDFNENIKTFSVEREEDSTKYMQKSPSRDQLTVGSQNLVKEEVDCDVRLRALEGGVSPVNIHLKCQSSAICSIKTLAPASTVCPHADDRLGAHERSAFKPISKHCPDTPSMCGSFPPNQFVYGGHAPSPCVKCLNIPFINVQDGCANCSEINIKEHVMEVNFDQRSSGAEKRSPTDAISTLRHKSCVYQHNVVIDQTHDSGAAALPVSLGAWFDWLRGKDDISKTSNLPNLEAPSSRLPPPPRYFCEACNKTYSTFGGLSKHRQFHCSEHVRKEFACKVCNKSYSSLGALKMHIRTHTLPCKCQVCGKAFSRPWLLQGHVRTHTGEKPFRCSHCGRPFADRSNLRAHLQTHADVKKYACKKCGKTFSRMSLLSKHSEGSCPGNTKS